MFSPTWVSFHLRVVNGRVLDRVLGQFWDILGTVLGLIFSLVQAKRMELF